jgi:hypothetical protein
MSLKFISLRLLKERQKERERERERGREREREREKEREILIYFFLLSVACKLNRMLAVTLDMNV